MNAQHEPQLAFAPAGLVRHGVRLRRLANGQADGDLVAHLNGLELGRTRLMDGLRAGDVVEVPVQRLPWMPLPAEIRFSTNGLGQDVSPPFPIASPDMATSLVGPGSLDIQGLRVEQGLLRGVAINRVNGMASISLSARVNAGLPRTVVVEAPSGMPDGGAAAQFAMILTPSDLLDSGLTITLHSPGIEAPVASLVLARLDEDHARGRINGLEARLARLEQALETGMHRFEASFGPRLQAQHDRAEAFFDYFGTLLLDRLGQDAAPAASTEARPPSPELAALRALIAGAQPAGTAAADSINLPTPVRVVSVSAPQLVMGWHAVEHDGVDAFRWMDKEAIFQNPDPGRAVAAITLDIRYVYRAAVPDLLVTIDGVEAEVVIPPGAPNSIRIIPAGAPRLCQTVLLESLTGGAPSQHGESSDHRYLSIAVSRIEFQFA